jgi:hypothetical protein
MLTLGQAAKETGVSKTAISRAIKSGRLSASKSEKGDYQIDPSELFRVYPVTSGGNRNQEQYATPKDSSGLHSVYDVLREMIAKIENERDDLRRRLDSSEAAREQEAEERKKAADDVRRLTLMLTHQPEAKANILPTLIKRPSAESAGTWGHVWVVLGILTTCTAVLVWIWWQNH